MNNSITIREYKSIDKSSVMNLIRLNTPEYFAPEEENDFSNYLAVFYKLIGTES